MTAILLVIHLIIALAMIVVVLIQRSEGGGLGIGGGATGGLMTTRGTTNLLTRVTAVLAGCFMLTSLVLAILGGGGAENRPRSIVDPRTSATGQQPAAPSIPAAPSAPTAPTPP